MSISILLLVEPDESALASTLQSVAQQTRPPEETIFCGGDLPQSADEPSGAIRTIDCTGLSLWATLSRALATVRSSYTILLRPGEIWQPDHLLHLAGLLDETSAAPGAVSGVALLDSSGESKFTPRADTSEELDLWQYFPLNPITAASQVLFRREILQERLALLPPDTAADAHVWMILSIRRSFARWPRTTVSAPVRPWLLGADLRDRWSACDQHFSIAQSCLAARLKYHPAEATRLRRRLRLMRHAVAWRFADCMLSPSQSEPIALALDELLAEESAEFQQAVMKEALALFPLPPRGTSHGQADDVEPEASEIPNEARRLRHLLRLQPRSDVPSVRALPVD